MKALLILAMLAALAASAHPVSHAPAGAVPDGRFDIAVTVDDLPVHGDLPQGMSRLGIAHAHLDAFKAHHVAEAFGFVNAAKIADAVDGEQVLDAWRNAGHPLGNHTASHLNIEKAASLDAWQADVIAGEAAIALRMNGQDWRYLRFPNLAIGTDRREPALAFLRARGYKVAQVSLAFGDWNYSAAYARCVAKGDASTISAMRSVYLQAVERDIANMKRRSIAVYGRVIPQVLLTHMGGWSAVTLPDVLALLDKAGARYVTLAQVQADAAYAEPTGGNVMSHAARSKGIKFSPSDEQIVVEESLNLRAVCR